MSTMSALWAVAAPKLEATATAGRVARALRRAVGKIIEVSLTAAGLAGIAVGVATWSPLWGWVAGGLGALILEWRIRG